MKEEQNEILHRLYGRWAELLVQILQSMTDQTPKTSCSDIATPDGGTDMFWWEQRLSLGESCRIWVGAPQQTWNDLGARTLRAAGIDTVEEADAKNTYLEILSQSLSGLAQTLGSQTGAEVSCTEGAPSQASRAQGQWAAVEIVYDDASLPPILLGFSPELMERLEPAETALEKPRPAAPASATALPQTSKTLDLLLDVELPVSVSFGRAELMLKDVLKLTTGSIVELNRGVSEPVEVIVNNCVVARGEVVVMDGNYGVRIHHIISPQERLRTLK
jgi:flagellar motor switch protein FliN/FliY